MLNVILQNLAREYDFDIIRKTVAFPLVPGTANNAYALPTDYLRVKQLFYYISQEPTVLAQMPYEAYNALYQGPGASAYPQEFAVQDQAGGSYLYPYPLPNTSIQAQLVYYAQVPDIINPATSSQIPWFPNSAYLYTKLAAELCAITDDARVDKLDDRAAGFLRGELKMINDDEGFARTVALSATKFRVSGGGRATKALPL